MSSLVRIISCSSLAIKAGKNNLFSKRCYGGRREGRAIKRLKFVSKILDNLGGNYFRELLNLALGVDVYLW